MRPHRTVCEYICYIIIRAALIAALLTFPCVIRSVKIVFLCFCSCSVYGVNSVLQECFCDFGSGMYIIVYHKHFRVPEHRAFIHLSRQTSCGNGFSFHISRSNTIKMIDRIIQGIFRFVISVNMNMGYIPYFIPFGFMLVF